VIIPIGFGQVNFIHAGPGNPLGAQCTLGFDNTGSGQTAQACADSFATLWVNRIMPNLSSSTEFTGTLVKLGPNSTGPSAVSPASVNGGDGAAQCGPQVACIISKVTAQGGRRGKGSMFLPVIEDSDVDTGGAIAGGKTTALLTDFNDFLVDAIALDLVPVLLHSGGQTPTPITEMVPMAQSGSQRRRNRR